MVVRNLDSFLVSVWTSDRRWTLFYEVAMFNLTTLIDDFFHMYVCNADIVSCLLNDGIVQ